MRTYPGLTGRMASLMACIEAYVEANGYGPSFDEMKEAMGLRSKSGIHRLCSSLEERGYIQRLPHRARAIEVLRYCNAPVVRMTIDLDDTGKFLRVRSDARAAVMVNQFGTTRPAFAHEVQQLPREAAT